MSERNIQRTHMASLQRFLPGKLVYSPTIQDLFISRHPFYFIIPIIDIIDNLTPPLVTGIHGNKIWFISKVILNLPWLSEHLRE